jgi:type I restriction enzyme S subunit
VKELSYFEIYQPKTISEKEMTDFGFYVFGANGIIGKYFEYNHSDVQTVVTCRGNSCGNIIRTLPKSWITGNAMVLKAKNQHIVPEFIFQMLHWVGIHKVISGSGQPQITRTNLETLKFVLPNVEYLIKYKEFVSPICNQRINLFEENQKLAELRDWLLPILMNGQVKLSER